jgi:hydroxymethylpyrimidine/phosphomethylpyrimidine kinase
MVISQSMIQPPVCLTIAGSDPSGGAGIQGDLKTFAAHGAYGMAVLTALSAQNTTAVTGVSGVDSDFVQQQLQAIYDDIPTDFVKTGMLLNEDTISTISTFFSPRSDVRLVVDPVMISSSGAKLLHDDAIEAYIKRLFPAAYVLTPNNLETRYFSGIEVDSVDKAIEAAEIIRRMGVRSVLVKGGDTNFAGTENIIYDVLNDMGKVHVFERQLIGSRNSHGTGCALAASICCHLAAGRLLAEAVDKAGRYVGGALKHAYRTGQGSGSINHLWNIRSEETTDFDDSSG